MSSTPLPPPEAVASILIWHQGALGDLLLAGPALLALRRRYPQARLIGLGHPERWRLLAHTLSLAEVWDSGDSGWSQLFATGPLSPELQSRLARFQLALVFSPDSATPLPVRLRQAGIPSVCWLPSFRVDGMEAVGALQARHLSGLGLSVAPDGFRLVLPEADRNNVPTELSRPGAWLAVAPGSGHPCKNWPLAHYYETSRALAWEYKLQVVWLAGPAEKPLLPYLRGLAAAQGHLLLAGVPLKRVAAVLSRCRLFLGNDSGLTHLAAALDAPAVLALFGPTNPRVWGPAGKRVHLLRAPCPQAPCARGREIPCPAPQCLADLSPEHVLEVAGAIFAGRQTGG